MDEKKAPPEGDDKDAAGPFVTSEPSAEAVAELGEMFSRFPDHWEPQSIPRARDFEQYLELVRPLWRHNDKRKERLEQESAEFRVWDEIDQLRQVWRHAVLPHHEIKSAAMRMMEDFDRTESRVSQAAHRILDALHIAVENGDLDGIRKAELWAEGYLRSPAAADATVAHARRHLLQHMGVDYDALPVKPGADHHAKRFEIVDVLLAAGTALLERGETPRRAAKEMLVILSTMQMGWLSRLRDMGMMFHLAGLVDDGEADAGWGMPRVTIEDSDGAMDIVRKLLRMAGMPQDEVNRAFNHICNRDKSPAKPTTH